MSSPSEEIFTRFFDEIFFRFKSDPDLIFSPNEKTGIVYKSYLKIKNKVSIHSTCLYPNCKSKAIRKSHCISENLFLRKIAKNNHLLTPQFNPSKKKVEMKKVGLSEASVFSGFCKNHESFFTFEANNAFDSMRDSKLQLFRTICREYRIAETHFERLKLILDNYKMKLKESLSTEHKNHHFVQELRKNNVNLLSVDFDYKDEVLYILEQRLGQEKEAIKKIKKYYDLSKSLIYGENKFFTYILEVDTYIPVSLSGRANFGVIDNGINKNIIAFINVLPRENESILMISTLNKYSNYLEGYIAKTLKTGEDIISMVETWMIRGSDHWFLNPDVWSQIDIQSQEQILNDILDERFNIGSKYGSPIFIDLRNKLFLKEASEL